MQADEFFALVTDRQESSGISRIIAGRHVVQMTIEEAKYNATLGDIGPGRGYDGTRTTRIGTEYDANLRAQSRRRRSKFA